jgi:phenylalanyl-tRNA synthetase alpha chain
VVLLDTYENSDKFWAWKVSYTWRIIYRSIERTLQNDEINELQERIRATTVKELCAILR